MQPFTFDETMMIRALEANGWQNVWDIYWIRKDQNGGGWFGLSTDDAFATLLMEKEIIQTMRREDSSQTSQKTHD